MKRKLLLLFSALVFTSFAFGQLSEGFETWPPTGWTIIQGPCSPTNDITQNGDQYHGGSYSARFSSYSSCSSGYDEYLITPQLVTTSGDQTITFWYRGYDYGSEVFKVGWSSTGTDVSSDFTWSSEISDASTTWQQYSKTDLPVGTKYVAIHYYSNYQYYLYIDDVAGPAVYVPACPAPTAQTETNITATSADLGWTAGGSETTWNIEWGPTGFTQGSGTTITGVTANPYTLSGLTAGTTYDWYVQADCGGDQSTWTGPSTFTTACVSVSVPWNEGFEGMPSVGSGIVPNCMAEDGDWATADAPQSYNRDARTGTNYIYTNWSADDWLFSPPIDLTGGTSYDFSFWYVTDGNSGWTTVEAKYGTGQTSGDMTTAIGTPVSGPTNTTYVEYRGSFTPATSGTYYMGIHVVATSSPWYITFDDLACELTPSCPAPTAQTETNITTTSADLGWTAGGSETTWNIEWGPTGFTQGSGTTITGVTNNPYTLSGLTAATTYDWYVQADCGGNQSTWTGPSTFTTLQAPAPVQSLPFSEDWESGAIGSAWNYNAGSVSTIEVNTASVHSGTYGLEQYGNSSSGYTTPTDLADAYTKAIPGGVNENWTSWNKFSVDLTSAANPWLSFWYAMGYQYNDNYNNFWVQVSTDGSTWTDLYGTQTNGAAIPYEKRDFDLSAYNGTGQLYIRFFHNGKYNTNYLWLDDITVQEVSCPAPSAQTETNITATSADLGWTENGTATTWNIEWGPTGFTQGSGTTITGVTNNPYTLTGLTETTTYDWYVQADCGGDQSTWTGPSTFTTTVACPAPTAQTETNITTTSADLGWTAGGSETTWNIEWGPTGFTQGSGTMITGTGSNPYNLTGLTSATTYDWYVQADCGGDQSTWTGPSTFTTNATTVTTFPWTEDFEHGGSIPAGWSNEYVSATVDWTYQAGGNSNNPPAAHSGSYNALFYSGSYNGDETKLVTLPLDLTGLSNPVLTFWHTQADWGGDQDELRVYYKTSAGGTWTLLPGQTYLNSITSWTEEANISLPNPSADYYIAFDGLSGWGYGVCVDDVTVEEMPSCPAPTAQTETNITTTSADLGWTAGGSETTWNIEWGPTGFTQGSGTTITGVTANPYTLSGLTAGTTYDWYVQAGCGSTWTGPGTFSTICNSTTVPYFENFDGVTAPAFPICMIVEDANNDGIFWETDNSTYLSAPNSAMITYNTSQAMDDWFFTQGLDLTGGITYEVSFAYAAASASYPEKLAVDWGNAASSTAMSGTPIFDNSNVDGGWYAGSGTFTPATTGTYYVGFHGYSDANMYNLYVDDVKVVEQVAATTWNGSVDNDWDKPGNWSSGLPSSGTDVTIPTGLTNYPTVTSATTIGSLLVASDATGDASILNDGLLIVSGNATVQRYVTGGVWHDVSASTQGQTLNSLYFNHSPDVWLRHYNEPDNSRTYLYTLTDPVPSGAGFEIWVETGNNVTVNYTGALQRSDVPLTTSSTPPLSYTGPEPLGYNLIGNPFASPLDLDEGVWSLTDVSTSFWVWDPNSGTSGTYLDWNTSTGTGSLTGGVVPMGQGFFIQATGASPSITIPMAARVHSSTGFYKNSAADEGDDPQHMSLRALMDNGYDEMNIAFIEEASQEFDTYDTRKMFAFEGDAPQIYSEQYGEQLSINGLPLLTPEGYEVKVGYRAGTNGDQTIEANLKDLPETEVLLEDLVTGNVQSLVDEPRYKFEAYVDDDPIRFVLHFNPVVTGIEGQVNDLGIKVYAFDGSVYIQSKGEVAKEKKDVWIVDMFGRTVLKTTVYPSTLSRIPINMDNAFIIVRTVCESGIKTTKLYIN